MSPFVSPFVPNARTKEIVANTFIMFSNISRQKRIPLRTTLDSRGFRCVPAPRRKLQLARFQWYLFLDDATYDGDVASLVSKLKESLAEETAPSDVAPHTVPNTPAGAYPTFGTHYHYKVLTLPYPPRLRPTPYPTLLQVRTQHLVPITITRCSPCHTLQGCAPHRAQFSCRCVPKGTLSRPCTPVCCRFVRFQVPMTLQSNSLAVYPIFLRILTSRYPVQPTEGYALYRQAQFPSHHPTTP